MHFDYKIAIAAMEAGADKVRINPGNIGSEDKVRQVVAAAKMHHVPLRVGANSGSIGRAYWDRPKHEALVESALENVRMLERSISGYRNFAEILQRSRNHPGLPEAS